MATRKRRIVIDIRRAAKDWWEMNETAKQFTEQADKRKKTLKDLILEQGAVDTDGHAWVFFDEDDNEPIDGVLRGLKREKRVSRRLNAERATLLLKQRGLLQQCIQTIEVLDEEAILALGFENVLTKAELNGLYDVTESYALIPLKV